MVKRNRILVIGLLFVSVAMTTLWALPHVSAQGGAPSVDPSQYTWKRIAEGLINPVYVTHAGDGSGRLFIIEQAGMILVMRDGKVNLDPFLDLSGTTKDDILRGGYSERGLLGLVFHPDYRNNGVFFVYYIDNNNKSILARYRVKANDPDHADPASAQILATVDQPFENHKGGTLAFGPDGYLYWGLGDGGSLNDPLNNGQNTKLLLAKMLRLDVSDLTATTYKVPPDNPYVHNPNFAPETWAYGLRNPYRFSFDRFTGDLYIADVGEATWEEVNFQPAGDKGGQNYGWRVWEAFIRRPGGDADSYVKAVKPVLGYMHKFGCSITGGYVYRGPTLKALDGLYFYGDYCNGLIWYGSRAPNNRWKAKIFTITDRQIVSFGEDEAGELYMVDYKGNIYRLEARCADCAVIDAPVTPPTPTPLKSNADWKPEIKNVDGIDMVKVPAGCFTMGYEGGRRDEKPTQQVCFEKPFWIDRTEVTNSQYGSDGPYPGATRPRTNVDWNEAAQYCAKRGARLPTEAEWEYAARGSENLLYPWGNTLDDNNVWVDRNMPNFEPQEVGSKPTGASWVGALDMSGNVWEWTSSVYRTYPYVAGDGREDAANTTELRVFRSGWYTYQDGGVSAPMRFRLKLTERDWHLGLRCVRDE